MHFWAAGVSYQLNDAPTQPLRLVGPAQPTSELFSQSVTLNFLSDNFIPPKGSAGPAI